MRGQGQAGTRSRPPDLRGYGCSLQFWAIFVHDAGRVCQLPEVPGQQLFLWETLPVQPPLPQDLEERRRV